MDSQLQISTTTCADLARNIAASCQRDRSRSSFYVRKRSKDLYLHTSLVSSTGWYSLERSCLALQVTDHVSF